MKQLKEKEYEEFQQYLYNKAHGYIWTPDTLELICGSNDNEPEPIGRQILEMLGRVRNEHKALALAAIGHMRKFLGRNAKPLSQDIPVAGTLVQHQHKIAVFQDVFDLGTVQKVFDILC